MVEVKPAEYMKEKFGEVCEPVVPDFTEYNACLAAIKQEEILEELNTKLEAKKRADWTSSDPFIYKKVATKKAFCDQMFGKPEEIDSKILCYENIDESLGPEKCLVMARVTDEKNYIYNLFYKYLCLYFELVELE